MFFCLSCVQVFQFEVVVYFGWDDFVKVLFDLLVLGNSVFYFYGRCLQWFEIYSV